MAVSLLMAMPLRMTSVTRSICQEQAHTCTTAVLSTTCSAVRGHSSDPRWSHLITHVAGETFLANLVAEQVSTERIPLGSGRNTLNVAARSTRGDQPRAPPPAGPRAGHGAAPPASPNRWPVPASMPCRDAPQPCSGCSAHPTTRRPPSAGPAGIEVMPPGNAARMAPNQETSPRSSASGPTPETLPERRSPAWLAHLAHERYMQSSSRERVAPSP